MKGKDSTKKSSKKKETLETEESLGIGYSGINRLMGTGGTGNFQLPPDLQPKEEEEQTISVVKVNEMKEDHQKRVDKLEQKIVDQKETIVELRREKKVAEDRAEKFRKENEKLSAQIDSKKDSSMQDANEISKLNKIIESLEKDLKTAEEDAQRDLKKDLFDAREKIEALKAENESMAQKIKDLEDNIKELKNDRADAERKLEEASRAPQRMRIEEAETVGIIRREGPTTFSSSLFISPRYDVKLAKSGTYIAFEPNVTGLSECVNNKLEAPGLDSYVGYQGVKDHSVIRKGTKLVIYL